MAGFAWTVMIMLCVALPRCSNRQHCTEIQHCTILMCIFVVRFGQRYAYNW